MNSNPIISSDDSTLADLTAVRQHWRWVLALRIAFIGHGSMAFAYSALVTLASMFVVGWALVFGGFLWAMHAFKVSVERVSPRTAAGDPHMGLLVW